MSESRNMNRRQSLIGMTAVLADSILELLRIYGFAVVAAILARGIIGGYPAIFGAMTISGAVLGRYLLKRNTEVRDETLLMNVPSVLLTALILLAVCGGGGKWMFVYALLSFGICVLLEWKQKSIRFLYPVCAYIGIAAGMATAVYVTADSGDISKGILMMAGSWRLFQPLLRLRQQDLVLNVKLSSALSGLRYPLLAWMACVCARLMKMAMDETGLFRMPKNVWLLAAGAGLLLLLTAAEQEERDDLIAGISELAGALCAGFMIFAVDGAAGIAAVLCYAAVFGGLVLLHYLRGGSGQKMDALRLMVIGLVDIVLMYVCLSRYNGVTFNLRAVFTVFSIMLSVNAGLQLNEADDIVSADEEGNDE